MLVRVGAIPGLNLRGDRREEMVDSDPYRIFRSAFASKTVRSAWAKSYGEQFWEASEPPQSQATVDDIKFIRNACVQVLKPNSRILAVAVAASDGISQAGSVQTSKA